MLEDAGASGRTVLTSLQSLEAFVVRRQTVVKHMSPDELGWLIDKGYAKHSMNEHGESVIVARLPELLASELASVLARTKRGRRCRRVR